MSKRLHDSRRKNPNPNLGMESLDDPHFDSRLIVSERSGSTNAELRIKLRIFFYPFDARLTGGIYFRFG